MRHTQDIGTIKIDTIKIGKIKKEIEKSIKKAGEILLSFFGNSLSKTNKQGMGFVTQADLASEEFLIEELSKILPGVSFYAEESGIEDNHSDYCFVIDPLDGTTNFAHGIPYFCISVALTYKSEPVLGFVYNPLMHEMFYAQKGKGAFLNDEPISISSLSNFQEAFLAVCIPYEKSTEYYKRFIDSIIKVMKGSFAFRHCGAAALDQAYAASGRFDAIFFEDMFWWDFAAGKLLIQEAGGTVSDFQNNPIGPKSRTFIGANSDMHAILLDVFKQLQ
ncbi:inositol monophosphatase family protein [Candidatus Dependentiae bacterium]